MTKASFAAVFLCLCCTLAPDVVRGETVLQRLDSVRSIIRFEVTAGNLAANGRFREFSGQLLFDPLDAVRSAVVFQLDVSAADFEPLPPANLFLFPKPAARSPRPDIQF